MLGSKMKVFYGGMSLLKWSDLGVALVGTPSSDLYGSGLSTNPAPTKDDDAFMHQ
jgi:hypothetical protein